jgi:hypothetical protein
MASRVAPLARGIRICTAKLERSARSTRIMYEIPEFEVGENDIGVAAAGQKTTAAIVKAWINLISKRLERLFVVITFNVVVEFDQLEGKFLPG